MRSGTCIRVLICVKPVVWGACAGFTCVWHTGKSVALDCMFAQAAKRQKSVVFQNDDGTFRLFCKDGNVKRFKALDPQMLNYLEGVQPDVWYFVDGTMPLNSRIPTFVSVSPQHRLWIKFSKKDCAPSFPRLSFSDIPLVAGWSRDMLCARCLLQQCMDLKHVTLCS